MRWAGHVARIGAKKVACTVSVGEAKGKKPLERPSRRWEDNTKMDHEEIEWGVDWVDQSCDDLRECGNEFSVSIKCGEFLE